MEYDSFIAGKLGISPPTGLTNTTSLHPSLFPFQADIVRWALRRGRAAIFAATGLGKTRMQLEWARHVQVATGRRVLILAPLAVAAQTAQEGDGLGVAVKVCRGVDDVIDGINITNYDRMHRFDPSVFGAVVLDESSCIKNFNSKTLGDLLRAFEETPFRLACTATPAPNDYTELGTHAEFLGVCSRAEMLAEFFCHDGGETQVWRLKGHARADYWRWVAAWAALVRMPSDLGYEQAGYDLPPLTISHHQTLADPQTVKAAGFLFPVEARSLSERRDARRASTDERVAECAARIQAEITEPWIVWCDLNAEADALVKAIPGAVEIRGTDDPDDKERRLAEFASGVFRVLISKPSICGFGLNWQHCSRVAFVGVTDSWESYHQAVRRCWRFGQKREVKVHIFSSELEGAVVRNIQRKEADAAVMASELSRETAAVVRANVQGASTRQTNVYNPATKTRWPKWMENTDAHDAD